MGDITTRAIEEGVNYITIVCPLRPGGVPYYTGFLSLRLLTVPLHHPKLSGVDIVAFGWAG